MEEENSHPSTGSEKGLRNLLTRLEHQSLKPDFQIQRQLALGLVLQPYLDPLLIPRLFSLREEKDLAKWLLYAYYFPTDGNSSLILFMSDSKYR